LGFLIRQRNIAAECHSQKGTFGNLGGRPKALAEVVELARSHTAGAIATLAEVATDSVVALLDYGWVGPDDPMFTEGIKVSPVRKDPDDYWERMRAAGVTINQPTKGGWRSRAITPRGSNPWKILK
jgi:hypothetical protein